jgi:phosphotransferase system HPr-like phosphotransfer protein
LLWFGTAQSTQITIKADGPDEKAAIEALGQLVADGFGDV